MRTSTIVMIGILGLAATPLALHLMGGSTGTSKSWIKTLHGGSGAAAVHGGSTASGGSGVPRVPEVPTGPAVPQQAEDKKPAPNAAATLAGKWTVSIFSDQGNITSTMVLKHEGRNLTGTFSNPHGEGTMPVVGELVGGALTLNVDAVVDHGEMHLAFKGTIKDDGSLAGKVKSAMGESNWTAVRSKDKG